MATKKETVVIPIARPRNPLHEVLKNKRGGAHGKTHKAQRQQDRQNMARDLAALLRGDK